MKSFIPLMECPSCGKPHDEPCEPGTERYVCLLTLLVGGIEDAKMRKAAVDQNAINLVHKKARAVIALRLKLARAEREFEQACAVARVAGESALTAAEALAATAGLPTVRVEDHAVG
jgi:hypothetical protein